MSQQVTDPNSEDAKELSQVCFTLHLMRTGALMVATVVVVVIVVSVVLRHVPARRRPCNHHAETTNLVAGVRRNLGNCRQESVWC